MKFAERLLERMRPAFERGGRRSRLFPVFQALDHFLLLAPEKTETVPFGRDPLDVKRYMILVIVAVSPCFAASLYFFGWRILAMLLVSYAAGGLAEVMFAAIRREEINEGFLVTGFLFPLTLPPAVPLWIIAVGVTFGVVVGKEVFGGTGRNLFNPALVGRAFVAIAYPSILTTHWIAPGSGAWGRLLPAAAGVDAVSLATPLVQAKSGELAAPLDLFLGRVTGSAGETSSLAILIGGFFLVMIGIANWRTVASVLLPFIGLNAVLRAVSPAAVSPVWFNLLAGGFLFGAFFMATDPVTGPVTQPGKWVYGSLIEPKPTVPFTRLRGSSFSSSSMALTLTSTSWKFSMP